MYWQWTTNADHSFPYITGNGFAANCKKIWNYDGYIENPNSANDNWIFIKTDYVADYFSTIGLRSPSIIFTHNSDHPITESYRKYLDNPNVLVWFAQNVKFNHPKLRAIPIGIANAGYANGDINLITRIREEKNQKNSLFYANYSIQTNQSERQYCLSQTCIELEPLHDGGWLDFAGGYVQPKTFEEYLRDLSKSYFCISPSGNGIDCHRTWESIYVGTIPIITRSQMSDQYSNFPIIVLDDWSDFKTINFNAELYSEVWNNFNLDELRIDNYLKRIISPFQ
jgi:hypothetical protein